MKLWNLFEVNINKRKSFWKFSWVVLNLLLSPAFKSLLFFCKRSWKQQRYLKKCPGTKGSATCLWCFYLRDKRVWDSIENGCVVYAKKKEFWIKQLLQTCLWLFLSMQEGTSKYSTNTLRRSKTKRHSWMKSVRGFLFIQIIFVPIHRTTWIMGLVQKILV